MYSLTLSSSTETTRTKVKRSKLTNFELCRCFIKLKSSLLLFMNLSKVGTIDALSIEVSVIHDLRYNKAEQYCGARKYFFKMAIH